MRVGEKVVERPQHMWMRVSSEFMETMSKRPSTYNRCPRSTLLITTPTLFNAGTPRPQLALVIFWLWNLILLKVYTTH